MNNPIRYEAWKEEHRSFLESFKGKGVVALYSGGKDSSLALDFMHRASDEFAFALSAHGSAYPAHRYTEEEKERLSSYWEGRGVPVTWYVPKETDDDIRSAENPCLPCQQIRKRELKTILPESGIDLEKLVLVASFSLWDIVSYAMEYLMGGILSSPDARREQESGERYRETAQRFYPLVRMKEGYDVFRPMIRYNGSDIVRKVAEEKIPLMSIPCEYKGFRPKRNLEGYYDKMGLHFDYDRLMAFVRKAMDLPELSSYRGITMEHYLGKIF